MSNNAGESVPNSGVANSGAKAPKTAISGTKTIYEKKDGIAYLTINNPEKANVMDDDVIGEMGEEYRDFWEDRDMRVMIITGIGDRHFSAGHNIQPPPPGMTHDDVRHDRIDQFIWPPFRFNKRQNAVGRPTQRARFSADMETCHCRGQRLGGGRGPLYPSHHYGHTHRQPGARPLLLRSSIQ